MSEHPPMPRLPARAGHAHTRPALDRRTVLRGLGAALTLPWLDAFVPRLARADTVKPPVRLAFLFAPNGVHAPAWFVEPGLKPEDPLSPSLEPLQPVRQHVTFLRGLDQDAARAHGDGPGDHARSAAVFLTSVHPVKTAGPGIRAGISIDQVAANKLRGKTRLASLEMGLERGRTSGSCDSGYACAYSNHISWADPYTPNPKEVDPRRVFERLFGADRDAARSDSAGLRRSVLDATADDMRRLRHRLGAPDRHRLDGWLEGLRSAERRIEEAERHDREVRERLGDHEPPSGIPKRHPDHARLMSELIVLAFQTDATRVITHMLGNGGSNRVYDFLGIRDGHHSLSHHAGDLAKIEAIKRIDRWHASEFAWLVQSMAETPDGDGMLIDNVAVLWGSGIRDGNRHDHHDLPLLLAGRDVIGTRPASAVVAARHGTGLDTFMQRLVALAAT
ncbi:MAG: DUF1552 domain-containing protein [Planctomycetota bacterium]